MDLLAGAVKVRPPSTTGYLMNLPPPTQYSLSQTPQHSPFDEKKPPSALVWSTAPTSKPLGHPSSSGFPSGNQTTSTDSQKVTFKPLQNPRLPQVVQRNAAHDAQQAAIFRAAQQMANAQATQQASGAGKPRFYPFHPGLTRELVEGTKFIRHLQQLFNGSKSWPIRPGQQGMNLVDLRAAGFRASADGHGLFHAIREGLCHAEGLKLSTHDSSESIYRGIVSMDAPNSPYHQVLCRLKVSCKEGQSPTVIKAHPLSSRAIPQRQ
jgi:hypothetical protein